MCDKCNDTGYIIEREDDIDEICNCSIGKSLCSGEIEDDILDDILPNNIERFLVELKK